MKQREPHPDRSVGSAFGRRIILPLSSDPGCAGGFAEASGRGPGLLETPSCRHAPNVYPRLAQMTPEEKACAELDAKVTASGWGVSDNKELNPSAVRGIDFELVALQADNLGTDPFGLL